jgi:effector-binding domain-containing protein
VTADHEVALEDHESRRTLVVPATTNWRDYPDLWPVLLDDVWSLLNAAGIRSGCPNVMVYLDDTPRVEVGVIFDGHLVPSGRVVASSLPAGRVATTTHRGGYGGLGDAHRAVVEWCHSRGQSLSGTRWEVYGPHSPDPAQVWTRICWLLS